MVDGKDTSVKQYQQKGTVHFTTHLALTVREKYLIL